MLLKLIFWILIACDLAGIGLLFLLGLAAAPSSHTNPFSVTVLMLVLPVVLLSGAVLLFLIARSQLLRGAAFLFAASPLLLLIGGGVAGQVVKRLHQDKGGRWMSFRSGEMQALEAAIIRNDLDAVTKAARTANLKETAIDGSNVLVVALRQLQKAPGPPDVVRALLQAGANPNPSKGEPPLSVAMQVSRSAGPEPVRLLLAAGANPNARTEFGNPAWFIATGAGVHPDVLEIVLDAGADVNAKSGNGQNAVLYAAQAQNWKAVTMLLRRGAEWKSIRTLDGQVFRSMLESNARVYGERPDLKEVIEFVKQAEDAGR